MRWVPLVSLVDDDQSVRESIPELLKAVGYASQAFASAEEFLASDFLDGTDCLLLDVAMPTVSGPALRQELSRRQKGIPVVFITAVADDGLRARLLAAGAIGVLTKPFSETALLDAISAALRPRRSGDLPR